ncbi:unnamed protein product [Urochloa humidicola]
MATHRLKLLLVVVMMSMGVAESMLDGGVMQEEGELEPADAGGYRKYVVFLASPRPAELKKLIQDNGEDDVAAAHRAWHESYLPSTRTSLGEERLQWSFHTVANCFCARLTAEELKVVSGKPGFIHALPNVFYYRQTTHTPAFLGLPNRLGEDPEGWPGDGGRGMIIGVLDGGIDPLHPSMADHGFEGIDPPAKWKGRCHPAIKCNRKLIGAISSLPGPGANLPPLDEQDGHGTHVASIAAGNLVADVDFNGLANGTASGMAPYAHVAIYKVCGPKRCSADGVLSAMLSAVGDGVDVISMSISGPNQVTYDNDLKAIGAFVAMMHGVLVVASAGNTGPAPSSVRNGAPWILTVAASTMDRSFTATVHLDGSAGPIVGESIADRHRVPWYRPGQPGTELLYSEDGDRRYCLYPDDEQHLFRDRIVICHLGITVAGGERSIVETVMQNDAVGVILVGTKEYGYTTPLVNSGPDRPVVQVPYQEFPRLRDYYYAGHGKAKVSISLGTGTVLGFRPAPTVASFSARGPNLLMPSILKPEVLAPGVNILAGMPYMDSGRNYVFKSGTSMATPHVSGLAALLKKQHPIWSPAAIRSALMTTADVVDNSGMRILDEHLHEPAGAYATGAGHVNLRRAMDPGLLYDEQYSSICLTLGEVPLTNISRDEHRKCSYFPTMSEPWDLNTPSIVLPLRPSPSVAARTLTNVGPPEVYTIKVEMRVTVDASVLNFTSTWLQLSYKITVLSIDNHPVEGRVYQGAVTWSSSHHTVRIPLVAVVGLGAAQPSTGWNIDD